MSVLLSTCTRTHTRTSSLIHFDSPEILNQMFSRKNSKSVSGLKPSNTRTTPLENGPATAGEGETNDRRRSMSDIPISKGATGRRKSADVGNSSSSKKSFLSSFRRRSKDQIAGQNSQPKPVATTECDHHDLKLTLGEVSIPPDLQQPVINVSKPIACHTATEHTHMSTQSVFELSESPKRFGLPSKGYDHIYFDHGRLSVSPPPGSSDEEFTYRCPSSPLLVAVRNAVDSLSQYNDFEILENIGSGFYAEVFKVRWMFGPLFMASCSHLVQLSWLDLNSIKILSSLICVDSVGVFEYQLGLFTCTCM